MQPMTIEGLIRLLISLQSVIGVLTDLCEAPLSLLQSAQVVLQLPHPQQLQRSGRMRITEVQSVRGNTRLL